MTNHLKECEYRLVLCVLCNQKVQYIERQKHEEICNNTEVDCPQKCGEKIKRKNLKEHFQNCKNKLIDCNFLYFGCKEKFPLKDLEKHRTENINQHLELFAKKIIALEESINKINNSLKEKNEELLGQKVENAISIKLNKRFKTSKSKKKLASKKGKTYLLRSEPEEKGLDKIFLGLNKSTIELKEINSFRIQEETEYKQKQNKSQENKNKEIVNTNNNFLNHKRNSPDSPNIEINNKDNNQEENIIESDLFDTKLIPKDKFNIKNNTLISKNLDNHYHIYIFGSEKYEVKKDSEKVYKFSIKLNMNILCLAFGFSDKKIVEENNYYVFTPAKNEKGEIKSNGSYILSINSMQWNANYKQECKKLKNVDKKLLGKEGSIIECYFNPYRKSLKYFFEGNIIASLSKVELMKSEVYTPCIIFLQNCSVDINFDYPN